MAGVLFVLTFATFFPAHGHPFTLWDDNEYVHNNPFVRSGLTREGLSYAFHGGVMGMWCPLTMLSFMLDTELFGLGPAAYHDVNVLLHCCNAVLLFLVLRQASRSIGPTDAAPTTASDSWHDANFWRCAMVAATFAIHPLRVESVAWIAERKDVLSFFFGLPAVWCYLRFVQTGKWQPYVLSLVWLALSLMSKPMFMTLPCLLLLLDYWPLGRMDGLFERTRSAASRLRLAGRLILEKLPMAALVWAACQIMFYIAHRDYGRQRLLTFDRSLLWANAATAYLRYMLKMVRFDRLAFYYPMPASIPTLHVVLSVCVLATLTLGVWAAAILGGRRYRYLAVGWFWFLGTLAPLMGVLVPIGSYSMADRYTYLPSIGLLIMAFWSVPDRFWTGLPSALAAARKPPAASPPIISKMQRLRLMRWVTLLACGEMVAVLFLCTRIQLSYWKTDIALFSHGVAVTENSVPARMNLAYCLTLQGDYGRAEQLLREASHMPPMSIEVWNGIGELCRRENRFPEAIEAFTKSVTARPRDPTAHKKLGLVYAQLHRDADAIREYELSLQGDPYSQDTRQALIELYTRTGHFPDR